MPASVDCCHRNVIIIFTLMLVAGAGCLSIGGQQDEEFDIVVNESIDSEQKWTITLDEGDRLRITADDGREMEFMKFKLDRPNQSRIQRTGASINEEVEAEHGGEYVVEIAPSVETQVTIQVR